MIKKIILLTLCTTSYAFGAASKPQETPQLHARPLSNQVHMNPSLAQALFCDMRCKTCLDVARQALLKIFSNSHQQK